MPQVTGGLIEPAHIRVSLAHRQGQRPAPGGAASVPLDVNQPRA